MPSKAELDLAKIRRLLGADKATDIVQVVGDMQDVAIMTASEMCKIARGAEPFIDYQFRLHPEYEEMAMGQVERQVSARMGQAVGAGNEAMRQGQPNAKPPLGQTPPEYLNMASSPSSVIERDLSQQEHDTVAQALKNVEVCNQRLWELQELAAKTDPFDSSYVSLMRDLEIAAHNYISACQQLRAVSRFR